MTVKAILKPHIGLQESEAGLVPYEHDQWMVYFSADEMEGERFCGYLPKKEGAKFCPAGAFILQPQGLQDLIVAAVSVAAGDPRPLGVVPLHPDALLAADELDEDEYAE